MEERGGAHCTSWRRGVGLTALGGGEVGLTALVRGEGCTSWRRGGLVRGKR